MGVYDHSGLSLTTELFYITINKNSDGTYSSDKLYGEIESAYNEGHMLYCVGYMIVPLVDVTEDGTFNFACPTPDGMICGFVLKGNPNGTVNVTYKESSVSGGSGASARIGEATLLANKWTGSNNLYSQIVTIDGVTANSQVDLTPSVEQLAIFYEKDLCFVTENEDGVVTVYVIGQKPTNDYIIQVTITEVIR